MHSNFENNSTNSTGNDNTSLGVPQVFFLFALGLTATTVTGMTLTMMGFGLHKKGFRCGKVVMKIGDSFSSAGISGLSLMSISIVKGSSTAGVLGLGLVGALIGGPVGFFTGEEVRKKCQRECCPTPLPPSVPMQAWGPTS